MRGMEGDQGRVSRGVGVTALWVDRLASPPSRRPRQKQGASRMPTLPRTSSSLSEEPHSEAVSQSEDVSRWSNQEANSPIRNV